MDLLFKELPFGTQETLDECKRVTRCVTYMGLSVIVYLCSLKTPSSPSKVSVNPGYVITIFNEERRDTEVKGEDLFFFLKTCGHLNVKLNSCRIVCGPHPLFETNCLPGLGGLCPGRTTRIRGPLAALS